MYTKEQVQEILRDTYEAEDYCGYGESYIKIRPRIICEDGYSFSMQASNFHYSTPRENLIDGKYLEVELGYPSEHDELIDDYVDCWYFDEDFNIDYTDSVYPHVPVEVVAALIDKHGGNPKIEKH